MDLAELQARARAVAERYDRHHVAAGRAPWTTADLALGFVGDVGELSVLVLGDRYQVDLVHEFARMVVGVEPHLDRLAGPDARRACPE